jgi:hypothetical protein
MLALKIVLIMWPILGIASLSTLLTMLSGPGAFLFLVTLVTCCISYSVIIGHAKCVE